LNNDKLKWIVRQQQLQMIKLMKAMKQPEEEKTKFNSQDEKKDVTVDEEEEFIFL